MGVIIKESAEVCPECGSSYSILDITRGEVTCQNCGLVIRSKAIDHSVRHPERYHRGGAESMIDSNKGLGSLIPKKKEDFYKKKLTPRKSGEIYRMRKWDYRATSAKAGPGRGLPILKRFCSNLQVPDEIREEAAIMMRKFLRKDLMRGRSFECTSAAVIYLSYKVRGYHRSLSEISEKCQLKKKSIRRHYKLIANHLKIDLNPVPPVNLLPQIMSDLGLPSEMEPSIRRLVKKYLSNGLPTGKDPRGIVGGAIYFACLDTEYRKTQEEVAKASKTTEATLRKRYHEISILNQ